jgi:hypothetical protein
MTSTTWLSPTVTRPHSDGGTSSAGLRVSTPRTSRAIVPACWMDRLLINYGPLSFPFTIIDKYEAYKARVRAAKPSDRDATEKKELEAVEREGLIAERLAERGYGKAMMGVPKGKLE